MANGKRYVLLTERCNHKLQRELGMEERFSLSHIVNMMRILGEAMGREDFKKTAKSLCGKNQGVLVSKEEIQSQV